MWAREYRYSGFGCVLGVLVALLYLHMIYLHMMANVPFLKRALASMHSVARSEVVFAIF
jgi:hypothetical protein